MAEITVNNLRTHYELNGEGEPIVFVHGLGSSARDWEPQIGHFSQRYQALTYDVRGHGSSEKPPGPYSLRLFADDLNALLDALGFDEVHLVGLSLGGAIGYQMAASYPGRLRSLVVCNMTPHMIPSTFKERLFIYQRLLLFRVFSMRKIGEVIGGRLFIKPEQAEMRQQFTERWAENDKRAYMAATLALGGWTVVEALPKMSMPVLMLLSDEDYTPAAKKEQYLPLLPDGRMVVVADARHALAKEKPGEFNRAVEDFIRSV